MVTKIIEKETEREKKNAMNEGGNLARKLPIRIFIKTE